MNNSFRVWAVVGFRIFGVVLQGCGLEVQGLGRSGASALIGHNNRMQQNETKKKRRVIRIRTAEQKDGEGARVAQLRLAGALAQGTGRLVPAARRARQASGKTCVPETFLQTLIQNPRVPASSTLTRNEWVFHTNHLLWSTV